MPITSLWRDDPCPACANLFSPPALQMLKIQEKMVPLPKALDDSARTYERRSRDAIERFLGTLEPCLTLLVGALLRRGLFWRFFGAGLWLAYTFVARDVAYDQCIRTFPALYRR